MRLSEWAIKRPVATLMIMLAVMVLGFVSLLRLELDILPKINPPVMAVLTELPGASAEEVLTLVTEPVEAMAATISGIKELQSVSRESHSVVILQFEWGTAMGDVRAELAEKLDVLPLPSEAGRPVTIRFDPGQMAMMQIYAASEDAAGLEEISSRMEAEVKPRLEAVPGVAEVRLLGGVEKEVRVALDPDKLYLYQIGISRVAQIIATGGAAMPLGSVMESGRETNLRLPVQYQSRGELGFLPVGISALPQGGLVPVVLSELGSVEIVVRESGSVTRLNGHPAVGLQIQKDGSSNAAIVARAVRQELAEIREDSPELDLLVVLDQGEFIEETLLSSGRSLLMGGFFALLVLLGFLGSILSTFIVAVAIPFSVLATFFLLFAGGMTLNVMTLGGLALGVGMFVDNSIVVIENIFRHMHQGKPTPAAAAEGSREVAGAITASTLTTAVVFLPVVFVGGLTGMLFQELALTVTFALFSSLIVSLTVIPMLAARWLRPYKEDGWRRRLLRKEPLFYRLLRYAIRRKAVVLLLTGILFIGSLLQIPRIGSEFLPSMDERMFSVDLRLPAGAPLAETKERALRLEAKLLAMDDVERVTLMVGADSGSTLRNGGSNTAQLMVAVPQKAGSTMDVMQRVRQELTKQKKEDEEIVLNLYTSLFYSPGSSANVLQLTVSGPDAGKLRGFAKELMTVIDDVPGLSGIQSNADDSLPELHLNIDKTAALRYGLLPAAVGGQLRQAVQGQLTGRMKEGGSIINVRVSLNLDGAEVDELVENIPLESAGSLVPLSRVATVEKGEGPVAIFREGQRHSLEVNGQIEGRDIGSVVEDALERAESLNLPEGYSVRSVGTAMLMQEGFSALKTALVLSLVLIYLVMAAQFESLRSPFVIILTAPLAVVGTVAALLLTRTAFGITAYIGVIMLGGIVVNNGIVLVDFMEKRRIQGKTPEESALEAVKHRTRPVLMTAFTTILGLLPLAARLGEGTELQAPLARAVIGGLFSATLMTLMIVPVLYILVYKRSFSQEP
jgi:hydrophobic/amphiphilic exporter-1 (mainly G- bacteria), HAE1 family